MVAWEFVVVYLAAFVLVQFAIYRYLRGSDDGEARVPLGGPPNADRGAGGERGAGSDHGTASDRGGDDRGPRGRRPQSEPADPGGDDSARRCPSCGAENEPEGPYTFCRNCATRLPG